MRFDSYHPIINFLFFTSVIAAAATFNQPVFLAISYLCPFIYSVVLKGKKAAIFNLALIPVIVIWTLWYAYYNHFGITNISVNFIGNQITQEALAFGFVIGIKAASVLMWFSCVYCIVSSDKVIYLFGRIVPKLSLFLSIIFRLVPYVKRHAKKVHTAQMCIGGGMYKYKYNLFRRIHSFFSILSTVIAFTLESIITASASMNSRGYSLGGRTTFSIYRFDNRDRSFVITLFLCFTVLFMGIFLNQTQMQYNPELILNKITPMSYMFYLAYGFLCLLPLLLQLRGELKFQRLQKNLFYL